MEQSFRKDHVRQLCVMVLFITLLFSMTTFIFNVNQEGRYVLKNIYFQTFIIFKK